MGSRFPLPSSLSLLHIKFLEENILELGLFLWLIFDNLFGLLCAHWSLCLSSLYRKVRMYFLFRWIHTPNLQNAANLLIQIIIR